MFDVASSNLWRLYQQGIFILKNISIVPSSYSRVSGSYLPFPLPGTQIKYGNLEVKNNTQ